MNLTAPQLTELRQQINKARQESIDNGHQTRHFCQAQHIDLETGKTYRLEHKPKGRPAVLKKYGHIVEIKDNRVYVQVPLGVHGIDYLGIDPVTKQVVCTLCQQG